MHDDQDLDGAVCFPTVNPLTLPAALREVYEVYEAGDWDGYTDRQPELDQAQADADRYYHHAYNPSSRQRRQW